MVNAGRVALLCLAIVRRWKGRSSAIDVAGYLERTVVTNGRCDSSMGFTVSIWNPNCHRGILDGEDDAQGRR